MAIDDFKVGNGLYALAYGQHVVSGILAGYDDSTPTAVKIKVLMGLGEWNAMKELSFDGSIIAPTAYTFHPGTLSTGSADPVQGLDTRFPNSIYHSRVAYYTCTLPDGLGAGERPDKMRVIAETLKSNVYDNTGFVQDYIYSTNPADVFADVVRRNCERLGLPFQDYMDWTAYAAARERYSNQILVDDGKRTPKNVAVTNVTGSGSLASGTWYYRVASIGTGVNQSVPSAVLAVESAASSHNNLVWDAVTGVTGYRIFYSYNDPTSFTSYFDVTGATTFSHTTTSGHSSGIPVTLPTGDWSKLMDEFQVHRAFTSADIVTGDALSAIMSDAASQWVRDGRKYRILLPNRSAASHTLVIDNTTSENFVYEKTPLRQRINQITSVFRNLDDNMKPDEQTVANDFTRQAKVGIVNESLTLGSMTNSQMRRISKWKLKYAHELPRQLSVTSQMDSDHLLIEDIVKVIDRQAGHRDAITERIATSQSPMTCSYDGFCEISDQISPTGKSMAWGLRRLSGVTLATVQVLSGSFVADGYFRLWVKLTPFEHNITEVFVQIEDDLGAIRSASYRSPQDITSAAGTVVRLGPVPPSGDWYPLTFRAVDIGWLPTPDRVIQAVHFGARGGSDDSVFFSEMEFVPETPRKYRVIAIEDRDSDASGDRSLVLQELYENAYDPQDAYIEAGDPPPVASPSIGTLTYVDPTITGTITGVVGTGAIHVLRRIGLTGVYEEIIALPSTSTSFTDTPFVGGTYYYKLLQDGATGESAEVSIVISLPVVGSAPTDLTGFATEPDPPVTHWDIELDWVNHGAGGSVIVERKIGTGSYFTVATLPPSATTYVGTAPPNRPQIYYRVSNTAVPGYSNELLLTTVP